MGDAGSDAGRLALPRFFVAPSSIEADRIAFEAGQQHQIRRVLRLRDHDQVIVCDGSGDEIRAVLRLMADGLWAEPIERRPGLSPARRSLWLYQSGLRGDRFTWLLQKGTEIGVRGFVPVLFRYTQQADYAARLDRYRTVVREAAEQCERTTLPEVAPVVRFADALAQCSAPGETCLLLDEYERSASLRDMLAHAGPVVRLFVGPEGGLAGEEREMAQQAGLRTVSLGSHILRSETAGLVAAALALGASGDLG